MFEQYGIEIILIFLIAHLTASIQEWYYTHRDVDIITHFLGGMALGVLIKNFILAVGLMILWEIIEAILSSPNKKEFSESLENKVRDILVGAIGWIVLTAV